MPVVPVSPLLPCTATKAIFLGYSIGQPELYHNVVSLENVNEAIPPHVSSTSTCSNNSPILQMNRCLSTAHAVVVLPRRMEENFAVKYQMVSRAGVNATLK